VRTGPAAELLTDAQLSALYGVRVSTVAYSDDGDGVPSTTPRRTIVVHYGS